MNGLSKLAKRRFKSFALKRKPFQIRAKNSLLTKDALVKIKDLPKGHRVKLFRLVLSTHGCPLGADYVATNDLTQNDTQATHQVCRLRWKIEQFHCETKQLTSLEGCQCRLARIVRNHTASAILVWVRLKQLAAQTTQTVYQLKHGLLSDYLRHQLKCPAILMTLAQALFIDYLFLPASLR
ncbi:MAG: hypothetical protein NT075_15645 [Chloroflexi bacterium]|nr:hypothetical protein [Chloroflexota bacterium]